MNCHLTDDLGDRSLSARRAWIEIKVYGYGENKKIVALRKESVDRNSFGLFGFDTLSVALRKESVDRNSSGAKADSPTQCRSPQGERG